MVMKRVSMLAVVASVVLSGCVSGPTSPAELRELQEARARWDGRTFANYAVEMRTECFCDPRILDWHRIEVVAGVVTRVTPVAGGADVDLSQAQSFRTVDQVFESIVNALNGDWLGDADLAFDPNLGYPTTARLIARKTIADADVTYLLRNVVPLP